jgi:hypothetical protein
MGDSTTAIFSDPSGPFSDPSGAVSDPSGPVSYPNISVKTASVTNSLGRAPDYSVLSDQRIEERMMATGKSIIKPILEWMETLHKSVSEIKGGLVDNVPVKWPEPGVGKKGTTRSLPAGYGERGASPPPAGATTKKGTTRLSTRAILRRPARGRSPAATPRVLGGGNEDEYEEEQNGGLSFPDPTRPSLPGVGGGPGIPPGGRFLSSGKKGQSMTQYQSMGPSNINSIRSSLEAVATNTASMSDLSPKLDTLNATMNELLNEFKASKSNPPNSPNSPDEEQNSPDEEQNSYNEEQGGGRRRRQTKGKRKGKGKGRGKGRGKTRR